jgi:tetratricopeptide (TPR) repeat protein
VAQVELHGGDLASAEHEVRADYEFLAEKGERYFLSSMAAFLARLVRDQGRDDEAMQWSKTAEEATSPDDLLIQALWRAARAPILARAGRHAEALELSTRAVDLLRDAETPSLRADVLLEHVTVLRHAGRFGEAQRHLGEALALYSAKGNLVGVERARSLARDLSALV